MFTSAVHGPQVVSALAVALAEKLTSESADTGQLFPVGSPTRILPPEVSDVRLQEFTEKPEQDPLQEGVKLALPPGKTAMELGLQETEQAEAACVWKVTFAEVWSEPSDTVTFQVQETPTGRPPRVALMFWRVVVLVAVLLSKGFTEPMQLSVEAVTVSVLLSSS